MVQNEILKDKIIVVKCGGAALIQKNAMQELMNDVKKITDLGIKLVLVHGGGPEISELCQRLQIPVQFSQGQRVTDLETLQAVQFGLLGKTNPNLVATLQQLGGKPVGLSGLTLLQVSPLQGEVNLGRVGIVKKVDAELIHTLLDANYTPIISPLGLDEAGDIYNINADLAAAAIAGALKAWQFILLTDVDGLYADRADATSRIAHLSCIEAEKKILQVDGGMIPKLRACIDAVSQGVNSARLFNGTVAEPLIKALFDDSEAGTTISG